MRNVQHPCMLVNFVRDNFPIRGHKPDTYRAFNPRVQRREEDRAQAAADSPPHPKRSPSTSGLVNR